MPETIRSLRCSKLPLALACPASQVSPAVRVLGDDGPARLGTAVHSSLASLVEGGDLGEAIESAAAYNRVDPAEVAYLAHNGRRAWERLRDWFSDPMCEVPLEFISERMSVNGHADVMSGVGDEVRILDWKTGYADEDHEQQMRGYAWLASREASVASVTAIVVRLREMTQDVYRWSADELDNWMAGVEATTENTDQYRPGRHCGFCRRRLECDARLTYVSAAVAQMGQPADLAALTDETLVTLYDRVRTAEAACEMARDALRAEVAARGGSVAGNGISLVLSQQERKEIDAKLALPVLSNQFAWGWSDLAEAGAVKVSKTAVEKLAMAKAARGQKTAAAKAVMQELDAAGAVIINTIERLEVKRNGVSNIDTSGNEIAGGNHAGTIAAVGQGYG